MRIAAIHAHPDDLEILAAGTLALLRRAGHEVAMATMTAGDGGSAEYPPDETARIRRAEAAQSASIIGAEYHCAEFLDLGIFNDDGGRRRTTELLRVMRPDVVLTASPADYHPDHEATSVLVRDACFAASVPNYRTGSAAVLPAIPHLYFVDSIEGTDREGRSYETDFHVDISAVIDTKKKMLACHESQRAWLKKQHGIEDFLEQMTRWSASVGKRAGFTHAEGFRRYRGHPYPQSPLLEQLLGL
jgi:LmbE family N-acetylglucosaminyl deacetylase